MSNVLQALEALDVASMSYQEWINVGMALQAEGYDCAVWDNWSRADRRYRPGDCERKWRTFGGCRMNVTREEGWHLRI